MKGGNRRPSPLPRTMHQQDFCRFCAAVVLLGVVLTACNSSSLSNSNQFSKRGIAPPANDFTVQDLTEHSILVEVPAGEWRMVRLDRKFFPSGGQTISLIQASFPSPGAEPWAGSGGQYMRPGTDELVFNSDFFFTGLPGDIPFYTGAGAQLTNVEREVALIFGSRHAPTRFYLGVVPQSGQTLPFLDNPLSLAFGPGETVDGFNARIAQVADSLARRPLLTANMESGRGGFGAVYYRFYLPSGEIYSAGAGPIKVEESVMTVLPEGIRAQQKIRLQVDEPMPENGVFAYIGTSVRQAGLCDWSLRVETPEFSRNHGSTYACASSYGPNEFVATDDQGSGILYGQPIHPYASVPTPPGTFKFEFSHTLTGRDGGGIEGYAAPVSAQIPSISGFSLGYINADFNRLYGWQMGPIEQPY